MFSLSTLIARRYLFSKKSHSVINTISIVSCIAVGIPVAGMIILLSVFNGFEDIVRQMYNSFDPDLKIEVIEGKFFERSQIDQNKLREIDGVDQMSFVLEDNVLAEYRGRQAVVTLMGVDSLYEQVVPMSELTVKGEYRPMMGFVEQALVGQGVAYNLGVNINLFERLKFYTPTNTSFSSLLPMGGYREGSLAPSGVFALDAQVDGTYVIVPLSFAGRLFDKSERASSLIVKLSEKADPLKAKQAVMSVLGDDFRVLMRSEQKAELYQIMTYEKWGIFFIISLVMVIASFSIIGSLIMLIIDKKRDTNTIIMMGGDLSLVRSVFIKEGMLISLFGSFMGLILGLMFCFLQQWTGLIKIPARTFLIDSYPVIVSVVDVLSVVALFFIINYIITLLTVRISFGKSKMRV